jgi:L-ascorbate metabolism protein UlaG (beta-lactamase superfamily)
MQLQLLRHATLIIHYGGHKLLIDPMLSHAEAMDPVGNAANTRRIPLVDLPITDEQLIELLTQIDAVFVTHRHRDHWDARAAEIIPKHLPLFCQPEEASLFIDQGFTEVIPVSDLMEWSGITIARTGGQHGTGEIGQRMGKVSGFVLRAEGEPTLYLAGDSIWCAEVEEALRRYRPEVTVVNAGAAQFLSGDPITMTAEDVINVCRALPSTRIVAVHMETINHCLLTRAQLRQSLAREGLQEQVNIPADGEIVNL